MVQSVTAFEASLDPEQSGRITRVLRAVWEGNGGSISSFPPVKSTGPLTDDDLAYLLTNLDDATAEFRRVGKTVTTLQLGQLKLQDPCPSLQVFVSSNLDSLSAKGLRVVSSQVRLGESDALPRWVVERGCLAMRGAEWIGYLAARKADELPPAQTGQPLLFSTLTARVSASKTVLTGVQFGKGDRAVSYESKERSNVLKDEDLARLGEDVRGLAVEEVTLALAGRTVNVDISTATALGPTSPALPLGPLLRGALPLLVKLQPDESAAVDLLLSPSTDGTLFEPMDGESGR